VEKAKTIILVALIIKSLVFNYILWYGKPSYEETVIAVDEPYIFEEPLDAEEALTPSKVVFSGEGDEYYILRKGKEGYQETWGTLYEIIKENSLVRKSFEDISDIETPFLTVYFEPWLSLEEINHEYETEEEPPQFSRVNVYFEEEKVFVWFRKDKAEEGEEKEEVFKLKEPEKIEQLIQIKNTHQEEAFGYQRVEEEQMKDRLGVDLHNPYGYLYLVQEKMYLSPLELEREDISTPELLKSIFLEPNLVRKIEERDDSLYTDGEKGLRLFEGAFEYSDPRQEQGEVLLSYSQALNQATEYLCNYGGWPSGLRLEELSLRERKPVIRQHEKYFALWNQYHQGFPLVGEWGWSWMTFSERGLIDYHRKLCFPTEQVNEGKKLTPPENAIKKSKKIYLENYPEEEVVSLKDFYLAYYVKEERGGLFAYPAWVCVFDHKQVVMKADDLEIMYKGEEEHGLFQS